MSRESQIQLLERLTQSDLQNGGPSWQSLIPPETNRLALIREALSLRQGNHRAIGLQLAAGLADDDKKELFPDFMQLARAAHGPIGFVRAWIASLPRAWVLERIDPHVEAILRDEEYDDYWMMLELLEHIAPDKAAKLAKRARAHKNPEIRELGELAQERLAGRRMDVVAP